MQLYLPTGNHYIALPTIRQEDGAVECLNVVLEKLDGLLELEGPRGGALLSCNTIAGQRGQWAWDSDEQWIPTMHHRKNRSVQGRILAPPFERFVAYQAPAQAEGEAVTFRFDLARLFQTINVRHELPQWSARIAAFEWSYTPGVVVELWAGTLMLCLSFRIEDGMVTRCLHDGQVTDIESGSPDVNVRGPFTLELTTHGEPNLLIGVGLSRVGARSADLEASRLGLDEWLRRTRQWLNDRALPETGYEPQLAALATRNGHFARFYAMSHALDTSRVVSMTSRSHRYYVSSAYWDRDSLLWLYPFLLRNDADHAEALLRYAFGPQLLHAGIHSRQIGGQVLEYGFELDELMAPLLAMGQWRQLHPERCLWREEPIRAGILDLLNRLRRWRVADVALYRTELMPTDDLIVGGRDVLTYNNALVLAGLRLLAPILDEISPLDAAWAREEAARIPAAIKAHLVRDGMYQWATDLEGNFEMYDEAAGSLLLLSYYGLCSPDDPAYRRTVQHLYSDAYPYWMPGAFSELGNRHTTDAPHPWILSACNSVLSGVRREEGLSFLRRARMDNGIACESVNAETGLPETGMHFATCAGFVAHAIATGLGASEKRPGAHNQSSFNGFPRAKDSDGSVATT
ncbi:MAG: glycoside hydrolase family 125 protein [Sumerlaeia bacterium]